MDKHALLISDRATFNGADKSIICREDLYLKDLVRYICLNSLRAKIVSDMRGLNRYKYSGHSVLMGKGNCDWQKIKYVLSYFGKSILKARVNYYSYLKEGMDQGGHPEPVNGGLIRSLGGWTEVQKLRLKGQDRIKGDERILGDGEFVMVILSEADEQMDRWYELKSRRYTIEKLEQRVLGLYRIEKEDLYSKGRQKV